MEILSRGGSAATETAGMLGNTSSAVDESGDSAEASRHIKERTGVGDIRTCVHRSSLFSGQ
jgi:hypothetical protein